MVGENEKEKKSEENKEQDRQTKIGQADTQKADNIQRAQENGVSMDQNGEEQRFLQQDPERNFNEKWRELYDLYFNRQTDEKLLKALFYTERFTPYVMERRAMIAAANPNLPPGECDQRLSTEIKEDIAGLFDKIYMRVDRERPQAYFQPITQEDYLTGIQRVTLDITNRLRKLETWVGDNEQNVSRILGGTEFYRDSIEDADADVVTYKDPEDNDKEKIRRILKPIVGNERIKFKEYIEHLDQVIATYIHAKEYTHNARAIFVNPPGEGGIWAQMQKYSEEFTMVDFDSMMLLPGARYFLRALSLYDKMLMELFASHDWCHDPDMFSPIPNSAFSKFELRVLNRLEDSYRNEQGELRDENGNIDPTLDDKLRSMLVMAIGASQGMFLNWVEKGAMAEAPRDPKTGAPTFQSYSTQDSAPFMAFNPFLHFFFRFQTQGSDHSPIFYIPVEGHISRFWDHESVWKNMKAFLNTFLMGKKPLTYMKLFADFCDNIGNVGGILMRDSWRTKSWVDAYTEYKRNAQGERTTTVDHLKTWKNLENIGYEGLLTWIHTPTNIAGRMEADFLNALTGAKQTERMEFFQYIFDKYFIGENNRSLADYLDDIRKEMRQEAYREIKDGRTITKDGAYIDDQFPDDLEKHIEMKTSKMFLYRTLTRLIALRAPTKLILIDRDRLSPKGQRRWKLIMDKMGNYYKESKHIPEFESLMDDLLMAESLKRMEISKKMREDLLSLPDGNDANGVLIDKSRDLYRIAGNINYRLDEREIRRLLAGKLAGRPANQIDRVIELYHKIMDSYYDPNSGFLHDKNNANFLDEYANTIKRGDFKYTFALDEAALDFIPFRSAGQRVLPRAIGDISSVEQNVVDGIKKFPDLLLITSINGKNDFSEIIQTIAKAKKALDGAIGSDYAAQVSHHMGMMVINYFKKDSDRKGLFGWMGIGRKNSIAAERVNRSSGVWEWDGRTVDAFCTALEEADIIKKEPNLLNDPRNLNKGKDKDVGAKYRPIYITLLGIARPIKLPFKLEIRNPFDRSKIWFTRYLFKKIKPQIKWWGEQMRVDGGGKWYNLLFEIGNSILPFVLLLIIYKMLQEALKTDRGGGK